MAAPFDHQRLPNQMDGMICGNAQPQVVILAYEERFVEAAGGCKKISRHQNRRRTDQTEFETAPKDIARGLAVLDPGIHPDAVSDPNLFRLADAAIGGSPHEARLDFELAPLPQVVGV